MKYRYIGDLLASVSPNRHTSGLYSTLSNIYSQAVRKGLYDKDIYDDDYLSRSLLDIIIDYSDRKHYHNDTLLSHLSHALQKDLAIVRLIRQENWQGINTAENMRMLCHSPYYISLGLGLDYFTKCQKSYLVNTVENRALLDAVITSEGGNDPSAAHVKRWRVTDESAYSIKLAKAIIYLQLESLNTLANRKLFQALKGPFFERAYTINLLKHCPELDNLETRESLQHSYAPFDLIVNKMLQANLHPELQENFRYSVNKKVNEIRNAQEYLPPRENRSERARTSQLGQFAHRPDQKLAEQQWYIFTPSYRY